MHHLNNIAFNKSLVYVDPVPLKIGFVVEVGGFAYPAKLAMK